MIDWDEYERRVQAYESEGMDRSDAQAVVEAELLRETNDLNKKNH